MNLSGGGAFGAALAAPILAPPPLEPVDIGVTSVAARRRSRTRRSIFAILGGCAFIADRDRRGGRAHARPGLRRTTAKPAARSSDARRRDRPAPVAALDTRDTCPRPARRRRPTGDTPARLAPVTTRPSAGSGEPGAEGGRQAAPPQRSPTTRRRRRRRRRRRPRRSRRTSAARSPRQPASKPRAPAAPAAASGAPFDRGAAAAALGGVNVQSCKKPDGPTGSATSRSLRSGRRGAVRGRRLGSLPGTPVGGCIAGKYRGAHVPAVRRRAGPRRQELHDQLIVSAQLV